jgi:choline dehydrogenase-like flavoprotein
VFTVRFDTELYPPDVQVTLRTSADWGLDVPGLFADGAWQFRLDERVLPATIEAKFLLRPVVWMVGPNLVLHPSAGGTAAFDDAAVRFEPPPAPVAENGRVARAFLRPDHDEDRRYDVVIVGSGVGGGVLADALADAGRDVLVLEAGPYLFPTHVANLPRRLRVGQFDKHVWSLWPEFSVENYRNADGSEFHGRQAFNLGGRSVFWGGLVPRLGAWELAAWPARVRDWLTSVGYTLAENTLHRAGPIGNPYQDAAKRFLAETLPDFAHFDAPVAVQYQGYTPLSIPGGMFSTADLLLEERLVADPAVRAAGRGLTINLNHAVRALTTDGAGVTGVVCDDLLSGRRRTYHATTYVLSAGTIESARIALRSGLADPRGLVGRGLTDHPILYTHFALPAGSPYAAVNASAKTWSRHLDAAVDAHPYNMVLELGADFNQGRYIDDDELALHRKRKGDSTLCEIVFLFNAALRDDNWLRQDGGPDAPPTVRVAPCRIDPEARAEVARIAQTVLGGLGAVPVGNEDLNLATAGLGGVAHEVGTLRMGSADTGVVDPELRFNGYDNLYVCDNSVFPTSPAANPTLTLTALAIRLAAHLSEARGRGPG